MGGIGVDGALALMNPKTQNLSGAAGGGKPEHTMADGAMLASGMPSKHWNAVRLVEMQDLSVVNELSYQLLLEALLISAEQKWRGNQRGGYEWKEQVMRLVMLVLVEFTDQRAFAKMGWSEQADLLQVKRRAWFETWGPRRDEVRGVLLEWVDRGRGHIGGRCRKANQEGA